MKTAAFLFVVFFLGVVLGNHGGDQATLRDCATTGRAEMVGGGTIICTVERKAAAAIGEAMP